MGVGKDAGLLAGVEKVGDSGGGDELRSDGVADVRDGSVAVDEVENLVGVEAGLVLDVGEAAGGGLEESDLTDALRAETVKQDRIVLIGERAQGGSACVGMRRSSACLVVRVSSSVCI